MNGRVARDRWTNPRICHKCAMHDADDAFFWGIHASAGLQDLVYQIP